jgi:poly(A) polymerase Pap1
MRIGLNDRSWPILLKKSTMVCAAEKYASEIEIFTFGRGFRTQISRSSVQKMRFNQSMTRLFGRTDFFNRIGRFLPVAATSSDVSVLSRS